MCLTVNVNQKCHSLHREHFSDASSPMVTTLRRTHWCYFPQLSPTNDFCYQQERFNLSGVIYITISSAHASLGGNSTKDPLRNCCWEKEQGTQNMHLSEHHSQALVAESDVTSCADLQNLWFQDKKPHLYLQILSRYLSSYLGRMTPLSLSVWRPGSCRFSGTLEDENK